ncbi:MAG: hypothetical protein M3Z41_04175 [Candidatus Eremiobacteraeota bacterium]|nr:hypothetical protein [Candidatus Eremiobacteraeota bacterium]
MTALCALTLFAGAQPVSGQYPALPQTPVGAGQYIFQPPPGWNRVQTTTVALGVWVHPGDVVYSQSIGARAEQFRRSLSDYAQQTVRRITRLHPDVKMGTSQLTTVCGGHPAIYLTYAADVSGRTIVYEEMLTLYGNIAYYATYARASSQPSLPAARHALVTLCGGFAPGALATASPGAGGMPAYTPSPSSNAGTPAPMQTTGYPVPTITPRLGP